MMASLIAICVRVLDCRNSGARNDGSKRLVYFGLGGLVTAFWAWSTARGGLLAGLVAVAVACLSARHCLITTRVGLLAAVLAIAGLTIVSLPYLDPVAARIYAIPLATPSPVARVSPKLDLSLASRVVSHSRKGSIP